MKASVVAASGSDETQSYLPRDVAFISEAIKARGINVIDVIKALARRGFRDEAQNLLNVVKLRVSGDYLQTSAIVRNGHVISAVNDPNDYLGPGTGYRLSKERRDKMVGIRDVLDRDEVLRSEGRHAKAESRLIQYRTMGQADVGNDPKEVVIGVSPAFGVKFFRTLGGHPLSSVLKALMSGIRARGCKPRVVRMRHTADTSFLGLSAARLAGSGVGIGIQAKGTSVIHQRDRLPHQQPGALLQRPDHQAGSLPPPGRERRGLCAGRDAGAGGGADQGRGHGLALPRPVALIYAIETALTADGAAPENIEIRLHGGGA